MSAPRPSRSGPRPRRRGRIGPVGSGWLLGHFWYGSVFLVNVPIVILALVGGHYLVPESRIPSRADSTRSVRSSRSSGSPRVPRVRAHPGARRGWTSTEALAAFGIAIVTLVLFVAWELHVDVPMLDMHFFRNPAFSTGTGGMILVFLAMSGVMFLTMQYFQLVLGYSPLSAAIRFLPMAPIMVLVSTQTPRSVSGSAPSVSSPWACCSSPPACSCSAAS